MKQPLPQAKELEPGAYAQRGENFSWSPVRQTERHTGTNSSVRCIDWLLSLSSVHNFFTLHVNFGPATLRLHLALFFGRNYFIMNVRI